MLACHLRQPMFKTLKFVTLCCFLSPPPLVARLKRTASEVLLAACQTERTRRPRAKKENGALRPPISVELSTHPHLKTSKRLQDDGADTSGEMCDAPPGRTEARRSAALSV